MIVTITTEVETVGWGEAQTKAPAEVVRLAKEKAEQGVPVVMGTVKGTGMWVVLDYSSSTAPKLATA